MPRIPPQARAVLFDAVGTLLHPEPPAPVAYARTAARYGLDLSPAEVRGRFVAAYRDEEAADAGGEWLTSEARERERWHRIVTRTLAGVSDPDAVYASLFDHFAKPSAWRLDPGVERALNALRHRGLLLGVGSNYDERLWPVLSGFPELRPLLDRVFISAAVGVRKPGAGFFRAAVATVACAPAGVLFVGDDLENDYAGATAAGLPALLLDPDGRHPEVPHRIASLGDLVEE